MGKPHCLDTVLDLTTLAPDEAKIVYTLGSVMPLRLKFDLSLVNVTGPKCPQTFEVGFTIDQAPLPISEWLTFNVKLQVAHMVIKTSD